MAAGLRNIVIKFAGDTKGLRDAATGAEKEVGKVQKAFQTMDKAATGILLGVGGAIAGSVMKTAAAADNIAKTSSKLGIATDAFQELDYWAGQNGISQQSMERAVGRLNQRIGLAIDGNTKYSEAFQALGVSVQDAQGKARATEDVLKDTIGALRDIEDPTLRSARASEVFGTKMARDLMPALEDGSLSLEDAAQKARDLGIVMDEDAINASVEFTDAMDDLKKVGTGLITNFAIPFLNVFTQSILPVLEDHVIPAFKSMGDWIRENQGVFLTITGAVLGFAVAVKTVSAAIKVWHALTIAFNAIRAVATALQWAWNAAMSANPIGLVVIAIAALIAAAVLLVKNWDTVVEALKAAWEWVKEKAVEIWEGVRDFFVGIWDEINEIVDTAIEFVKDLFLNFHPLGIIISNWEPIKGFVTDLWDEVVGFVSGIPGRLRDTISNFYSVGVDIIQGIINGIWNMGSRLGDAAVGVARNAFNAAKSWLGIGSPSKLFSENVGRPISEGIADGVIRSGGLVEDAVKRVTMTPLEKLRLAAEMFGGDASELLEAWRKGPRTQRSASGLYDQWRETAQWWNNREQWDRVINRPEIRRQNRLRRLESREQDREITLQGELFLDSGEFLGAVRGVISDRNRDTKRRVIMGSGVF